MRQGRVKTLEGIVRILGAKGFKKYAKDYFTSRVNLDSSVIDAVNLLDSLKLSDDVIYRFNDMRYSIETEYATDCTPYYNTKEFQAQCDEERREFGHLID